MNRNNNIFKNLNVCDPALELIDPNPDVHQLFLEYDKLFFGGILQSRCCVRWSTRMTLCAGTCAFDGAMNTISLSKPLLSLRPRSDCINTLLHEMIHAYLFLTQNNRDRDGHGPNFQAQMHRINKLSGSNITIYHTFHDEVAAQRKHVWQCDGPCKYRPPYYGKCSRAMNRPPGKNDSWYEHHQKSCGGNWMKVSEPEKKTKAKKLDTTDKNSSTQSKSFKNESKRAYDQPDISKYFKKTSKNTPPVKIKSEPLKSEAKSDDFIHLKSDGHRLGGSKKTSRLLDKFDINSKTLKHSNSKAITPSSINSISKSKGINYETIDLTSNLDNNSIIIID